MSRARAPVAVIDIGSNSGRVVVYAPEPGGALRILASTRASLRLVRELDETHALSRESVERAMDALRDFKAIAVGGAARRTLAVATAAVRDAANGRRFIERVRRELGIAVRILSGEEEARYGFLGAVRGLPVQDGFLFDLGGGSLQLSRFRKRSLGEKASFPLGALRLSDAFLKSDPPTEKEMRRLRNHARSFFEGSGMGRLARGEALVGTGGTVRNLAKVDQRLQRYPLHRLHAYALTRERAERVVSLLASRKLKKRVQVPGLNDDRGDSIVGGGLAIVALMEWLGAGEILVSGQGVREGLALGLADGALPPGEAMRRSSAEALARAFRGSDPASGERRRGLAAALFDALEPDGVAELREALLHAATLLDIGRSIDFFDRHEHLADIVVATDLLGFTHRGIALLSAVARSAGDDGADLARYAPLVSARDHAAIERAATLLVLADDIEERCPDDGPISLRVSLRPRRARVAVKGLGGWRPRRIGARFADAFGRDLAVVRAR
ncbi:MAG TPA: Ppx/GppA phosphatase family protein [Vicinamibacteria bacterium]|nr:Ppx/GppA phosphatase family protein [Vicinamibacteria bacterium]